MRITRKGIWFQYEGDTLCRSWFWNRSVDRYYSEKHNRSFYSLKEYLKFIGATGIPFKSNNIMGFNYLDIISQWIKIRFSNEVVVVLTNINADKKPSSFWSNIPYTKKVVFTTDVVVLICKDVGQAKSIVDSVNLDFAEATCYRDGQLTYWNSDIE